MRRYVIRRLLLFIPQLLGVVFIVFFLIRLLPGDPARQLAGILGTKEHVARLRADLGLDKPLLEQFWIYLGRAVHGDLGRSITTSNPVLTDISHRLPATLELIGISIIIGLALTIPLGLYTAIHKTGLISRGVLFYGLLAGALPDFWLGLLFIYIFFAQLGIAPAPAGQLDIGMAPPDHITGMYPIDALLTANWAVFGSAVAHLALPVATLVLVYFGLIIKMTRASMEQILDSPWMRFAVVSGVSRGTIMRYGLRNSLPPILTIFGVMFLFLIGGAVLVETVFAWGGLGQYSVQAIAGADYQAVQGFVLVAAIFSLALNLVIDLSYGFIDPRIRYAR